MHDEKYVLGRSLWHSGLKGLLQKHSQSLRSLDTSGNPLLVIAPSCSMDEEEEKAEKHKNSRTVGLRSARTTLLLLACL